MNGDQGPLLVSLNDQDPSPIATRVCGLSLEESTMITLLLCPDSSISLYIALFHKQFLRVLYRLAKRLTLLVSHYSELRNINSTG